MSKLMQETLHNSKSNTQRLRNYSTYTTKNRRARVPFQEPCAMISGNYSKLKTL